MSECRLVWTGPDVTRAVLSDHDQLMVGAFGFAASGAIDTFSPRGVDLV